MKKERIELIVMLTACMAFAVDVIGLALQVQIPLGFLRLYYVPVFAMCLYSNAKEDMEHQKAAIRKDLEASRTAQHERFLEDYAKFVSEVHK